MVYKRTKKSLNTPKICIQIDNKNKFNFYSPFPLKTEGEKGFSKKNLLCAADFLSQENQKK